MIKKLLFTSALCLASTFAMNAQTTIFSDSFENYTDFATSNVGNWTLLDLDLAPYNYTFENATFPNQGRIPSFIVFNTNGATPVVNNSEAKTGNKYMAAFASFNIDANDQPLPVVQSDWLISPQIILGSENNTVKFWAKSYTTQYGAERFKVLISNTNTTATSFTAISSGNYVSATNTTWTEYTYNIPASYNSQGVYIAIQCVSNDAFIFMVDDFSVTTTGTASTQDFAKLGLTMYPNPVNDVLNISSDNGLNIQNITITDINGRTVKQATTSQINVSDLASGTYIVKVQADKGTATSKFIKK